MSQTSYNDFNYPCWPRPQTHPRNLAGLAYLNGIEPPPLETCRVLEIGCNDGGNLTPIAGVPCPDRSIKRARIKDVPLGCKGEGSEAGLVPANAGSNFPGRHFQDEAVIGPGRHD